MKFSALILAMSMLSASAFAKKAVLDDLDYKSENIQKQLEENDIRHAADRVEVADEETLGYEEACRRETCKVFIEVNRSTQRAKVIIDGVQLMDESGSLDNGLIRATTGMKGHGTPSFDRHIDVPVRAFKRYSSSKYPGGNWINPRDGVGYGNMPFVVFINNSVGIGIHGTTAGNIKLLGTKPLSHGCIRIHPYNAMVINDAVAKFGGKQTWIYVHD